MDNRDYAEIFAAYGLWTLVEDISDDGIGILELTEEGLRFVRDLTQKS